MIVKTYPIGDKGAELTAYILQNATFVNEFRKRAMIIICPGGGYAAICDHEAEPVAARLLGMGIHACVLRYSIKPHRFPQALTELAQAVAFVRRNAAEWLVDTDKVYIMGFSAGGHLAASLGVFWDRSFLLEITGLTPELIRPNGIILGYPVITSGEFASKNSIQNLLGELEDTGKMELVSLEKQVTEQVPPIFIWHTFPDTTVPLQNTVLFMNALCANGVQFEAHIFPRGPHGLALATEDTAVHSEDRRVVKEVQGWIDRLKTWMDNIEKSVV